VDPITAALAAGAAAGLSGVATQVVKDAYARLKAAVAGRFPRLDLHVHALEARPDSRRKKSSLAKELVAAGAHGDPELLDLARALLRTIEREAPEAAARAGVDLRKVLATGSVDIEDAHGDDVGVRIHDARVGGDIRIRGARGGRGQDTRKSRTSHRRSGLVVVLEQVTSGGQILIAGAIHNTLQLPRGLQLAAVAALLAVVLSAMGWAGTTWVLPALAPNYRTEFLVDAADTASADGLKAITQAVKTVVQNSGKSDALAMRRFGGPCGDNGNTQQLVGFGTGNRDQIVRAADGVRAAGGAALERGIVEAVADLSTPFSLKARQVNRVIVITRHGRDACDDDAGFVMNEIHDRVAAAGLRIQVRLVGYQVADDERQAVAQLASATQAPSPDFATNQAELDRTLNRVANLEPAISDVRDILSILNPAVANLNASAQAIAVARFDVADQDLARARSSISGTDAQFRDLQGRAAEPAVRAIFDLATSMRGQQERLIQTASDMLGAARAGASWSGRLASFSSQADTYNAEVERMNQLLAGLQG
jgi:hypothetical protein